VADQYIGEIRMVPFNFAPVGWALCNGQVMPINQNTALFSLLGVNYGGNGISNFALPNLQGSAPMNQGNGAGLTPRSMGETGGETAVTVLTSAMPAHAHAVQCGAISNTATPGPTTVFGGGGRGKESAYAPVVSGQMVTMSPQGVGVNGGSLPHNNMPPFLTVNFIISLTGIFPPRS
jgi:microcystin-dependent protein